MKGDQFDYLIADPYDPAVAIPDSFTTRTICPHLGRVPLPRQNGRNHAGREQTDLFRMAPSQRTYEIAAGINVERYDNAANYPAGIHDDNYYSEVWIPIRKK